MSDSNLTIKVGVESSAVKTGLAAVRGQLQDLRSHALGLFSGAAAGFGLASLFDGALEKAKELHQLSRRFGDTPEDIQKLGAAVRRVGGDMETAAKGGFRAFIEAQKAVAGDASARQHFADLGITLQQLQKVRGSYDAILLLADAVQHATDQHKALAAVSELVGQRQVELIQLFRLGGDAMRKAGDDAVLMGNKTVESLARGEKAIAKFKAGATNIFGNALATAGSLGGWWKDEVGLAFATSWQLITKGPRVAFKNYDEARARFKAERAAADTIEAPKGDIGEGENEEKERQRALEEITKLKERLAADELATQRELMSLDEKRNSLFREHAQLMLDAKDAGWTSEEGLQKRIQAERVLQDIHRVEKEQADAQRRAEDDSQKSRDEAEKKRLSYMEKYQRVAEHASEAYLEGLDDPGKKSFLEQRTKDLAEAVKAEKDPEKQLDLVDEKIKLDRQLASLNRKDTPEERRQVYAGDLTRHGGGGIAYFDKSDDAAKRTARAAEKSAKAGEEAKKVLDRIDENTKHAKWR